ncbi:MAG: phosphatase PAP2 family protein [Bacteroidota bacterium]
MSDLLQYDVFLIEWLHANGHNGFLDWLMPMWRNKLFWIPLYILIAVHLFWKFQKKGFWIIALALLTIGLADTCSSKVIKPWVQRARPCQSAEVLPKIHPLVTCGSGYSFPSSHATNHFALAMFLGLTLTFGHKTCWLFWGLILWAASISFGQVYVGLHYPTDILAGALLGSLLGWLVYLIRHILERRFLPQLSKKSQV